MDDIDSLLHRLLIADRSVEDEILERAWAGTDPRLLVAAALLVDCPLGLLARAARSARTTRDRQLVAIAAAHAARDRDRMDALLRDHLIDHPDNLLAAWIAGQPSQPSALASV